MAMAERSQYETEHDRSSIKRTVIGMIILALITLIWGLRHIENDLTTRSAAGLAEQGIDTESLALSFSGRSANIQVTEGQQEFADEAAQQIASVYGVRNAVSELLPAEQFSQVQSLAAFTAENQDTDPDDASSDQAAAQQDGASDLTAADSEAAESDTKSKWWRVGSWVGPDDEDEQQSSKGSKGSDDGQQTADDSASSESELAQQTEQKQSRSLLSRLFGSDDDSEAQSEPDDTTNTAQIAAASAAAALAVAANQQANAENEVADGEQSVPEQKTSLWSRMFGSDEDDAASDGEQQALSEANDPDSTTTAAATSNTAQAESQLAASEDQKPSLWARMTGGDNKQSTEQDRASDEQAADQVSSGEDQTTQLSSAESAQDSESSKPSLFSRMFGGGEDDAEDEQQASSETKDSDATATASNTDQAQLETTATEQQQKPSLFSRIFGGDKDKKDKDEPEQENQTDSSDQTTASVGETEIEQINVNSLFVEGTSYFSTDSFQALNTMADGLRGKSGRVEVVASQPVSTNPMFSAIAAQSRANMVLFALMQRGINPFRLSARGIVAQQTPKDK